MRPAFSVRWFPFCRKRAGQSPRHACRHAISLSLLAVAVSLASAVFAQTSPPPGIVVIAGGGIYDLGQPVTLRATAPPAEPLSLSFRWRRDNSDLPSQTDGTFVIPAISQADVGTYFVTVDNFLGTSSGSTRVSVRDVVLQITSPPRDLVRQVGQAAIFTFSASGRYPRTLQWRKDGAPIPGATNEVLTLPVLAVGDAGVYSVVVSNAQASVTSSGASLAVNAATPIAITQQPFPLTVVHGQIASFGVGHNGSDPFSYQWRKDGTPIAGATGASYEIRVAVPADAGNYSATVTNAAGTVTTVTVPLVVTPAIPPTILQQPRDFRTDERNTVVFGIQAGGSPPFTYQWYRNDQPFGSPRANSFFFLEDVGLQDSGRYHVTVTNIVGRATSDAATLTVEAVEPPRPNYVFNQSGYLGGAVYLQVSLFQDVWAEAVQWYRDGLPIGGATDTLLTVTGLRAEDAGDYYAVITTRRGAVASNVAHVEVGQPLPPAAPAAPIDARPLAFVADSAFVAADGIVHLYSKAFRQIFRWSSAAGRYIDPIPLSGRPSVVVHSAILNRIFLGHADARIIQIRLDLGRTTEEPFANAPGQIFALTPLEDKLLVVDSRGGWIFSSAGMRHPQRAAVSTSFEYPWSGSVRRFFYFRDGGNPNDLNFIDVAADGAMAEPRDSPYHGGPELIPRYPILISPDGATLLLGSGQFFSTTTLRNTGAQLSNTVEDAAWLGSRLFTMRITPNGAEVQRWLSAGAGYSRDRTRSLGGRIIRLLAVPGNRLAAVTVRDGRTVVTLLDEDLEIVSGGTNPPASRLMNLSTRGFVGRDDQILIPGFVIAGPNPKRVLVRAAGPALGAFGVPQPLRDPTLTIYNGNGAVVASNNDWSAQNSPGLVNVMQRLGAFPFNAASRDAAIFVTLNPGAYSVQVRGISAGFGIGNETGVALVEVYDAQDDADNSRLVNIATRAQVGGGAGVMISGFFVQGDVPKTLLIRAVGPGLAAFGITGLLANPRLRVFRGDQVIYENDDWGQGPSSEASAISAAAVKTGAFALPTGSRDAAVLLTLTAGAYSVQVSGVADSTGVALVEVYEVNN